MALQINFTVLYFHRETFKLYFVDNEHSHMNKSKENKTQISSLKATAIDMSQDACFLFILYLFN